MLADSTSVSRRCHGGRLDTRRTNLTPIHSRLAVATNRNIIEAFKALLRTATG